MIAALRFGLSAAWRCRGLAAFLLLVNLATAAILATSLFASLEAELANRGAAARLVAGFDHDWWRRWSDAQSGHEKAFGPEILGAGFAFRNLELLLKGELPARLFRTPGQKPAAGALPAILALGAAYLALQAVLAGGLLATLRGPRGGFTWRGFAHACGHYAGPLARLSLLLLASVAVVFLLNRPFSAWVDERAHEALSERSALAWALGRHLVLLLALLLVHLVGGYAKAVVVLEERRSAALAALSALAFVARNKAAALGHLAAIGVLGLGSLAAFVALDAGLSVSGYRSQLLALALMQGFVLLRIGLRLALAGGQLELLRLRR
jgi:hypothetical protein